MNLTKLPENHVICNTDSSRRCVEDGGFVNMASIGNVALFTS